MRRLLLVRHAATPATRAASFPADDELDARGRADAAVLDGRLRGEAVSSPATRCRQTAAAAGLEVARVEPRIGPADFGAWAGRQLAELDPAQAAAWMGDPSAAPHGGESLLDVLARVSAWMDDEAERNGRAVVITHAEVVKAAVVQALAAPPPAFWRIDVAPLSVTELHARDGRWTLTRVNVPMTGRLPLEDNGSLPVAEDAA